MTEPRANHPLVELRGLGVTYQLHRRRRSSLRDLVNVKRPELWALRDVSLDFHRGQLVGVVGDNGAGKSTLCMVISQILSPTRGSVVVRSPVTSLLSVGAGYDRDLPGLENMRIYAAFLGIPPRVFAERVDDLIEFSGLGDFVHEPLRTYSTGMRARLGFSVATIIDPEVLILDEVLRAGDRQFRKKVKDRIEGMMSRSSLVIIVSHTLSMLRQICTHAVWLESGRVVRVGTASEVIDAYENSGDASTLNL